MFFMRVHADAAQRFKRLPVMHPVNVMTTVTRPGTSYTALRLSVSVSLSVTSRCSIEVVGRIELVFGTGASFDQSYTVF